VISTELGEQRSPEADLLVAILDAIAAYERTLIHARPRASIDARRRAGRAVGPAPLGQRIVAQALTADAAELEKLSQVRALRAQGLSLARVAALCAERGVLTRRGMPPSLNTVARWCRAASVP